MALDELRKKGESTEQTLDRIVSAVSTAMQLAPHGDETVGRFLRAGLLTVKEIPVAFPSPARMDRLLGLDRLPPLPPVEDDEDEEDR
jgi:hypothetical protein